MLFPRINVFGCARNLGSFVFTGLLLSACHFPRKVSGPTLPKIFPDAARALGPFTLELEKSRESSVLSEARVKVEQDDDHKHVTLQIKMLHIQENVRVSFQRLSGEQGNTREASGSERDDLRCLPSQALALDAGHTQTRRRHLLLDDESALSHIPLPRSIRDASTLEVRGAGEAWDIVDDTLIWNPENNPSSEIALSWARDKAPELRYPLQARTKPQNLRARRIDDDSEESISVEWLDGFVIVPAADVKPGSWLELRYDVADSEPSFLLPQQPAFGNTNILSFQDNCPREAFLLERSELGWDCPKATGSLWAVSYSYRQPNDAWDFHDWPELSHEPPGSVSAFADAGEKLDVSVEAQGHMIPKVPPEASRVCLRAIWSSDQSQPR